MDNGHQHTADRAQVARGNQLADATTAVLAEVAESAMLLSQGARRAIEMKREASEARDPTAPATPARAA